jgi:glycosyltransferase involved in cell wall biosynthesis
MPRILIFSYYFPPMGGVEVQRVTHFVQQLSSFGWQPIVVTTKSSGHTGKDDTLLEKLPKDLIVERILAIEHPSTVLERWLKRDGMNRWEQFRRSPRLLDRALMRLYKFDKTYTSFPDPMNWWAWHASFHIKRLCRKYMPDILWATGYPWSTLTLLAKAGAKTGIPTVGDIRDPWSWHPQGFWSGERHRNVEQSTFNKLTHIVTVTDGFRRKYISLYPELQGKISKIRNCYEDSNILPAKKQFTPSIFCYIGSLTTGNLKDLSRRTLDTFLNALNLCLRKDIPGTKQIRVQIAGNGVEKTQELVDEYQLSEAVEISGSMSYDKANEMRADADVLVLVMGIGKEAATFVPLKLYEYLAANRPILALLPEGSEAGKIILEKKRGVVCRINDVEGIALGIEKILNCAFEYDSGSNVSEFSCRSSTEKLAKLFDEISLKQGHL